MPSTRPFSARRAQPWRWTIILLVLLILAPAVALARPTGTADVVSPPCNPPICASESTLAFRGSTGAAVGRTFILKDIDGSVGNVRISVGDLLEQDGRVILATQITVDPAQIEDLDDEQTVTVTVDPGTARSGTFTGTLSVWYASPPTATVSTTPLTITLQVSLNGVPDVSADPGSNNQTLFGQTTDMPFVGGAPQTPDQANGLLACLRKTLAKVVGGSSVLGALPITLVESAQEPARVVQAEVLPVKNDNGLTLPDGVVRVATPTPSNSETPTTEVLLEIPGNGAATLSLEVAGRNLPAGTYNGSVRILVENQPTVVSVPFTMKLKDGAFWAFLVLAASMVVGIAVNWYNRRGGPAKENIRKIDEQRKRLDENSGHLQIEEHNWAADHLQDAMDAVRYQEPQTVIDQRLQAFVTYMDEQTKAVQDFLAEIRALGAKIDALIDAPELQGRLRQQLSELQAKVKAKVNRDKLASLAAGRAWLQKISGELEALRSLMADRIDDLLATLSELDRGQAAGNNLSTRLTALRERLRTAEPDAFGSINAAVGTVETEVRDLESLQDVIAEAQQLAAQHGRSDEAAALERAPTVAELREQLDALRSQLMPTSADPAVAMAAPPFDIPNPISPATLGLDDLMGGRQAQAAAETPQQQDLLYKKFVRSIRWQTGLIQGLIYLFALLVGWAALYLPNATFGARPEDYITLFLWGATVNVVAGSQIKLESIWGHKVTEVKLNGQSAATQGNAGETPDPASGEPADRA